MTDEPTLEPTLDQGAEAPDPIADAADPIAALLELEPAMPPERRPTGFVPFEARWDGQGKMPSQHRLFGAAVPFLPQIHPRQWERALLPLDRRARFDTVHMLGMSVLEMTAGETLLKRMSAPPTELAEASARERSGELPPAPEARRPQTRQVNVRLSDREYEELQTAAEISGTKATTLARWFLLSGARRVVAEHGEAYVRSRSAR